jgi:hypothetical protein
VSGKIPYSVRIWRRLNPGRNPLARLCDRLEAVLLIAVVLGAILALPIAAAVGSDAYGKQTATARMEQATRHPVTAVAIADAPPMTARNDGAPARGVSLVPARWHLPDGQVREATVLTGDGTVVGDQVPIWLNDLGEPVPPPATATDAAAIGIGVAAALWLATITALGGVFWLGRVVCDRSRARDWEREWRRVSSDWSRS